MSIKPRSRFTLRTLVAGLTLGISVVVALSGWSVEFSPPVPSATDEILRHVKQLASEEFTGRGVDSPGIRLARD